MRSRDWFRALLLVAATVAPLRTTAQVIFVSPCALEIPLHTIGIMQVWVCMEGAIVGGITSAQFRITGLPAGWITQASPRPGGHADGDLFGDGVSIAFSCAVGVGQYLELFDIALFATSEPTDVLMVADKRLPAAAPPFDCPFVTLCDAPTFTKICCSGYGAWINPRKRGCALAVEPRSWGEVKALFQ